MATAKLRAMPYNDTITVNSLDDPRIIWTLQLNGTALNLTDVTWALRVSTLRGGTSSLAKTTTTDYDTSGVKVDDAANGQITIVISEADITTLGAGTHWYEVVATFPSDHGTLPKKTLSAFQGSLVINQSAVA